MEPKSIAVFEISSSKIKCAVGRYSRHDGLTVLAVEELPCVNTVRYGRVQNIRDVTSAVNTLLSRVEKASGVVPDRVCGAGVAIGGRSMTGILASASMKFTCECEIKEDIVNRLRNEASHDFMGHKNIEDVVPRIFYVNNAPTRKPEGIFCTDFRGDFVMIACGRETRQNLQRVQYGDIAPDHIHYIIRPTAVSEFVLTPDERELGAAVVDIGAETTTVTVYKDGGLAFLCTIPMGSRLITFDLMAGLAITEDAAEALKKDMAKGADIPNAELAANYINSRAGEIVANVLAQLENVGYKTEALSKVVLTGGGSHTRAFVKQFENQSKASVRIADMPRDITFRVAGRNNADNIDVVALLMAAARTLPFDCLSAPAEPDDEADHNYASDTRTDEAYDDTAEQIRILEEERRARERDDERRRQDEERRRREDEEHRRERTSVGRRIFGDDDDDILKDDEEEEPQPRQRRGGLFGGWFGRKKDAPAKHDDERRRLDDERDGRDGYADDDEQPIDAFGPDDNEGYDDNNSSASTDPRTSIDILQRSLNSIFRSPSEDDDD